MRRFMTVLCAAIVLALTGCSGDVNRATISLGESDRFSRTEIQAAADVVLAEFRTFRGCTLLRLTYDEGFSERQGSLTWPPPPDGDDVVLFTSDFAVDWTGGDGSLTPDSTYTDWTWEVARTSPEAPWTVTNRGMA